MARRRGIKYDYSMREEVQWWQEAGRRDLAMAERLLKARFYEGTAFHAQQAAEKFLKALLAKYRMELRTHSCAAMLKKLHKKLLVDKKLLTLGSEAGRALRNQGADRLC